MYVWMDGYMENVCMDVCMYGWIEEYVIPDPKVQQLELKKSTKMDAPDGRPATHISTILVELAESSCSVGSS